MAPIVDRLSSRARTVVAGIGLTIGLVLVEAVAYVALERHGEGIDGMPTVAWEEFPEIDRGLLEKFSSFDPELGWCPQPNTTKQKDTGEHLPGEEVEKVVEYSTDEHGSRVCPARDRDAADDADVTVSTYGDSYCFCRGVDDDETFQHFLAQNLDTHVANYGAGNYGFDQALMRLKRQYPEDPTDYVCVAVTASSIARIRSAWKHYQEFGNVLAVKPRYEMEDGSLERVESPIDEKEELLDVESHGEYLRSHDYHYEPWFRPHLASFPYSLDFYRNADQVRYALYAELADLEERLGTSIPGLDTDARLSAAETRLDLEQAAYHDGLFDEERDLFDALVDEFVSYADEEGFTPVFVMVQQLRYAKYEEENGPVYDDFLDDIDERHDELVTVDVAERLSAGDGDAESLYVRRGEGGHYSPETNERIADILTEDVFAEERTAEAGEQRAE